MSTFTRLALVALPALCLAACAHPQTVTLTSAQAPAAAAPVAPPAAPKAAESKPLEGGPALAQQTADGDAKPPAKKDDAPISFEALSAQLGGESKMALDSESVGDGDSVVPTGKGLSAAGYQNAAGIHQAVPEARLRNGGDVKVSGGLAVASIRDTVRGSSDRLRVCYERGLATSPRAAGHVKVSFSVDANGNVGEVDAESDTLGSEVTSCVSGVFASMTFAAPKSAPAKITYPIEFTKQ